MNNKNPMVIIESRYFAPNNYEQTKLNEYFAELCLNDSLINHNEDPYASHLLLTRILDDNIPAQRSRGIEAGLRWGRCADKSVVYTNLGISPGMEQGIERAKQEGRPVEYRELPQEAFDKYLERKALYDSLPEDFKQMMFAIEKIV